MLTRLIPEQISDFWPVVRYAIEESLPPTVGDHPDKMNRILSAALCGKLDVWMSYEREEGGTKLDAVVVTKLTYDDASNTRGLLIYCLYGYRQLSGSVWKEGLATLAKYAKGNRCSRITAYTDVPAIIKLSNDLGGETKYTFISFDVNEIV